MTLRYSLMWFATSAVFAMISLTSCVAQDEARESVSLPLKFQPGAGADVSFTKTFFTNEANSKVTVKATAVMEIISNDQTNPLMSWTLKSYEVEDESPNTSDPVLEKIFIDLPTQFTAGKKGEPISVENAKSLVADMIEKTKLPEFDDEDYKGFLSILDMLFNPTGEDNINFMNGLANGFTAQFTNTLFVEIPDLISLCQGSDLVIGEWKDSEDVISAEVIPGFGPSLELNVKHQLASVDRAKNIATINYASESNTESQTREMTERLKEFHLSPPTEKDIEFATLFSQEKAQCSVDLETGWVQDMNYEIQSFHRGQYDQKNYKVEVDWR